MRIEYVGIVFLPVFWVLLAARIFGGRRNGFPGVALGAMVFCPPSSLVLNYTNDWHHLYYCSLGADTGGPSPVIVIGKGVWYWVFQVYVNVSILTGNVLLIGASAGRRGRPCAARLGSWSGVLFPWTGILIY